MHAWTAWHALNCQMSEMTLFLFHDNAINYTPIDGILSVTTKALCPRCPDTSALGHFGTDEIGPKCPDTSAPVPKCLKDISTLVPKCLGAKVSRCRSVRKSLDPSLSPHLSI